MHPTRSSQASTTALTTTYAATTWTIPGAAAWIDTVDLRLTSISGAASITWYLAEDSAGERALTPATTVSIVDHDADGTGSLSALVGRAIDPRYHGGAIYLLAKTDAGTATLATTSGATVEGR